MEDIRIASVIFHAPVFHIEENIAHVEKWVKEAEKQGVKIICFPEMNITGYSTQRDIFLSMKINREMILQKLSRVANQSDMVILAGFAEQDGAGHVYATHAVVKPDGEIGLYRKVYLAPPEIDVFTPADEVPLFEACGVKFGIQLCYDAHFPELTTHMAINGADIVFIPHASPRGTPDEKYRSWMRHLPARAYDNSIFVVACNQTGDNGAGLDFPGLVIVIDPSGEMIDHDRSGMEGIVVTELKAGQLERVRGHRMRYFLPNRRNDLSFFRS